MSTNHPLIIIGTGLAGYSLAKYWRQLDQTSPLLLITADKGEFYHKPMLSAALGKQKEPDALVSNDVNTMASSLNATIHTNTVVTGFDADKKIVYTDQGNFHYSQLVLATGSIPKRLAAFPDAMSINHLDDYRQFRQALVNAKTINIIGAGLIGVELTNDLLHTDVAIRLISDVPEPLTGLAPKPIGQALKNELIKAGVSWLETTSPPPADISIQAIGLTAAPALSTALDMHPEGIVVDAYGRTSCLDVYAIGDCAHMHGVTLRYIAALRHQAMAMAKTLTQEATAIKYPPMPVLIKTTRYPIILCIDPWQAGEWQIDHADDVGIAMSAYTDNKLIGYALAGKACKDKMDYLKKLSHPKSL